MCDVFVRPSIIEGFGNAFVEAFAAGIPVVATPVGGIPDFLFDPEANPNKESPRFSTSEATMKIQVQSRIRELPTGIFCNVRDPQSIAVAVKKYLDNPELTAQIVKNARALVVEKYDWNIIAADMVKKVFVPLTSRGT